MLKSEEIKAFKNASKKVVYRFADVGKTIALKSKTEME